MVVVSQFQEQGNSIQDPGFITLQELTFLATSVCFQTDSPGSGLQITLISLLFLVLGNVYTASEHSYALNFSHFLFKAPEIYLPRYSIG